jgi:UDP-N-acetylmuramyl pentapeptide phosphotransferase/UDP-N-acetylglucosamine-1-phosphate transferase
VRADAWPTAAWIVAILASFAVSALATRFSIVYAHRRRLIDEPGARRSHAEPTPRGGGIGIVIAVLACACLPTAIASAAAPAPIALVLAIVLVAAVGWIDDHRGLSARWRFLAHCVAAALLLSPLMFALSQITDAFPGMAPFAWAILGAALLATVWSINLHNFMDGTDGILAVQAIFVFVALAILCARAGSATHAGEIAVFAAATAGFLPFNFPRARVFMGDVGSGVLGLLVAVAVLWQMQVRQIALASGLVLCSAFVVDASCTLASRMLRGRRWYSAHREHLYQWLARDGGSHARVVAWYLAWNLLIVVPVVAWINRGSNLSMRNADSEIAAWSAPTGAGAATAVYLVGVAAWWAGKRYCLRRALQRKRHAAA